MLNCSGYFHSLRSGSIIPARVERGLNHGLNGNHAELRAVHGDRLYKYVYHLDGNLLVHEKSHPGQQDEPGCFSDRDIPYRVLNL